MYDFKVLIVDDEEDFRKVYKLMLEYKGYSVSTAESGEQCLDFLKTESYDLVLTDLKMNGIDGVELLKKIKELGYGCEVILVTAFSTVENAVTAMKLGAFGYFIKGQDPQILLKEIEKLVTILRLKDENARNSQTNFKYLLDTKSEKFREVLRISKKAAEGNSNILILGESGTGKEVIAKFIHSCSSRRDKNFVAVNCQAFSENLLESELFGHEKGAFTGATEKRIGRFEEADKGMLFLDEIGEISQSIQVKLLRVIENKIIERIGSNKEIDIDIKLISATNKDLFKEICQGGFREDLFYRINTITVYVPPLRERREDIPAFIDFFLKYYENEMKKKIISIDSSLMEILINYNYPGNIRELKNIIERLVVLSDNGILEKRDLPVIRERNDNMDETGSRLKTLRDVRQDAEIKHIKHVLMKCGNNISEASRILDISRRQLYNKLHEYNIELKL
ncbi:MULTISPECIES: sigma-54-dependent transcriptional regulator [unclassified Sedimentibacter]|uniref:sigma-54-dependent transcriptional regulator n=1 Tax=unclassified Sedimentibacter TaxID=2649220 RepID=UPI0027DFD667|nr:sigma-54 dependent transcriptional regulator [Sedimentibacter sp. MB35-C1]WMJ78806.1 sigma-54 dependent transcriptional regulator [Sedimentibacter sp. MB35-C1]